MTATARDKTHLKNDGKTTMDGRGLRDRLHPLIGTAPTLFFWYIRVSGVLSILAWLSSDLIQDLAGIWPLRWISYFGWFASLPYGLSLVLLSTGLRRRKQSAWRITLALFTLFFVVTLLLLVAYIIDPQESTGVGEWLPVAGFGAAWLLLLAARPEFNALPDRANRRLAAIVFGSLLVVTLVIGTGLVSLTDRNPKGGFWTHPLYAALQGFLGAGISGEPMDVAVPRWVNLVLGVLGIGLLLTTLWALFRPGRREAVLSPGEELPARSLLLRYGDQDSLGYFALRRDKDVIVAPNGNAAISYRIEGSVSLASGDPLGDPESWDGAIKEWLAECRAHSWIPGVVSAGERAATAYGRHGFDALELGDEAILDTADFNLEGREMRQVRQAVHRVERAGYTTRIRRHGSIPPEEMAELVGHADQWREGETERGFSMALGRLGDPTDRKCVMVEAFDANHELRGLLSFVPWGPDGLSLDLMRRDRDAENGLNEYMVAKLAEQAPKLGVRRISLNFAMLRSAFERGSQIGASPVARLYYRFLSFASRFWQLESLYLANAKYHPVWTPRFVCYLQSRDLVRLALAFARAEGFLPTTQRPRLDRAARKPPSAELIQEIRALEDATEAARAPRRRLSEQERVRHAKLAAIRASGRDPYPLGFERAHRAAGIHRRHADLAPDTRTGTRVSMAGRVIRVREHGRLIFAHLRDETGDLQIMLAADVVGTEPLRAWKEMIDLGDQIGVEGEVITSRTGELSVLVAAWTLTAKCLRPLPMVPAPRRGAGRAADAGPHGFTLAGGGLSEEMRVRQRYVDFIVNDEARRMLRMRSEAVAAIRDRLRERGYLEVETPMLQPIHGGAAARPFTTRINAYNMRLYLRIAPELYLKRLLVGGIGKVFELGRDFRNEGVDSTHNPEFTMLEAYEPYGDYDSMADLTRSLVIEAARAALGGTVVVHEGVEYDLAEPWEEITVYGSVSTALGEEVTPDTSPAELCGHADRARLHRDPEWGPGKLVQELYEHLVEPGLAAPTLVRDFPAETSPLTRPHRADPRLAEKWDLIIFGMELATAYSELIDPVMQRQRLTEQSLLAAAGGPEAMELDEDFLRALEYAMPPSGGMGMGIDRLMIALTGQSIRETIAFPLVRPG